MQPIEYKVDPTQSGCACLGLQGNVFAKKSSKPRNHVKKVTLKMSRTNQPVFGSTDRILRMCVAASLAAALIASASPVAVAQTSAEEHAAPTASPAAPATAPPGKPRMEPD